MRPMLRGGADGHDLEGLGRDRQRVGARAGRVHEGEQIRGERIATRIVERIEELTAAA